MVAALKKPHLSIVLSDQVRIPPWVTDLRSFRRWARSEQFPRNGWFSFLNGELWVDLNLEQLFTHNRVKAVIAAVLTILTETLGYFFSDRALLSNKKANLSTEPDGCFVSLAAVEAGDVKLVAGVQEGFVELEGTPEMVLEVVSSSSVHKDTVVLRELYWKAGIAEYWLVDARGAEPTFDILRRGLRGYVAARKHDGWMKSNVLGRQFRLAHAVDRLGNPRFKLETRP